MDLKAIEWISDNQPDKPILCFCKCYFGSWILMKGTCSQLNCHIKCKLCLSLACEIVLRKCKSLSTIEAQHILEKRMKRNRQKGWRVLMLVVYLSPPLVRDSSHIPKLYQKEFFAHKIKYRIRTRVRYRRLYLSKLKPSDGFRSCGRGYGLHLIQPKS